MPSQQLVNGIQEIKLNNSEKKRRSQWEVIQIHLFKLSEESLSVSQKQLSGGFAILTFQGIIITFLAAKAVINGQITLGMMLSIQFIMGQISAPLTSLIQFIQTWQDARISFDRLESIQSEKEEENPLLPSTIYEIPLYDRISFKNLNFSYGRAEAPFILEDLTFEIPRGKVTAIVGSSGSGKTTLLKILLKFYENYSGGLWLGNYLIKDLENAMWRKHCGVVMQEGFIFDDSIENNISESSNEIKIDPVKMTQAIKMSCLEDMIKALPLGLKTKIGTSGLTLSGGQKQRVLIARAIYKDPPIIFLDEATSSLDAGTEKLIGDNLQAFYKGRTVVIVAHRLSTVKSSDNIIVLEKGKLVEQGTHKELISYKGAYFELIKNQLELESE